MPRDNNWYRFYLREDRSLYTDITFPAHAVDPEKWSNAGWHSYQFNSYCALFELSINRCIYVHANDVDAARNVASLLTSQI